MIAKLLLCAALLAPSAMLAQEPNGAANAYIDRVGEGLLDHFSDDVEEEYPFGRSDKKRDAEIAGAGGMQNTTTDWKLFNRHFLFDGDWFAVEWFYSSKFIKTGGKQIESTLAFGRVKDGKLAVWNEYFDDLVGELEQTGDLPLYREDETPFPWPAGATMKHPYRP